MCRLGSMFVVRLLFISDMHVDGRMELDVVMMREASELVSDLCSPW